ncbi:FkbM family methyltransferase [Microvirga arabica]|uniref:FkbM family methyltransferase n=1 Tax=Microvirga arabica TaxID=1128671 RepID=UPI00193A28F3|nr:FkbM family methyltransferase [Microvirga arabica]MBM1173049.1 FkbM family methyltransferase [Microvirga arabica]
MLTEEDKADRFALRTLFEKRLVNEETKAGFFYFENQRLMIAEGPETYVVVPGDMAIGYPLFMNGESDFSKFKDAMKLVNQVKSEPIEILWDIGANIGSICIPAVNRNLVKKAVAFEPEKRLFKLLRANAVLNEVDDRITFHNTALGAESSTAELMIGEGNTGDYRIVGKFLDNDAMDEASRQRQTIKVQPLDNFADSFEARRTLIFMDIQGYEGLALSGAQRIISTSPPLVTEFWPYAMKRLDAYKLLRDIVCSGIYSEFADLSSEAKQFSTLTASALDELYGNLGEDHQKSTDLLFV